LYYQPLSLYPSPLVKGRGKFYIREASPLFDSPHSRAVDKGSLKGLRPFKSSISPSPSKKRGD